MILELAGAPKTGKTLLSNALERLARADGLHVRHFHGGGRYLPLPHKGTAAFNLAVAARNLYQLLCEPPQAPSLLIMDRGVVDALIFSCALADSTRITSSAAFAVRTMLDQEEVWKRIDHVALLVASSTTLLERELASTGRNNEGSINNMTMRDSLISQTWQVLPFLENRGVSTQLINTDGKPEALVGRATEIYSRIQPALLAEQQ
jgi:hypothetical protein